jgi:hypothetical protein
MRGSSLRNANVVVFTIYSFCYLLHVSVVQIHENTYISEITLLTTDQLFLDINVMDDTNDRI